MATKLVTGFVGYPSRPPSVGETLRAAAEQLNASKQVYLKTWEELQIGGRILIDSILAEIDGHDLFVADLTYLNQNVLYELGYAIAKNKRVWLLFDPTVEQAQRDWRDLSLFSTVGYSRSTNTKLVVDAFYSERPHETLQHTLFEESFRPHLLHHQSFESGVFYVKPQHGTNAANAVEQRLRASVLAEGGFVSDDPRESPQPLLWYAQQLHKCRVVVCQFESPTRAGSATRNAKVAFVAGMAHGFGRDSLLLADTDYSSPLDYKDRLQVFQTARAAETHLRNWLGPVEEAWERERQSRDNYSKRVRLADELTSIGVGDYIAENEEDALRDGYFVPTAAYHEALRGTTRNMLFVGQKGVGKTANFIALEADLATDKRHVLCTIRPAFYDLAALVNVLDRFLERDRKTYVIEALWRLLLYSEVAAALKRKIEQSPVQARSPEASEFMDFCTGHSTLVEGDFAVRLESALKSLETAQNGPTDTRDFREVIGGTLNHQLLPHLRARISSVLPDKGSVVLLVDNLDKAWERHADLSVLSEFLLGLLRATNKLANELRPDDAGGDSVRVVVFLRSDIFDRIRSIAREPDKLRHSRLRWDDPEQLVRLVDERLMKSMGTEDPESGWRRFFCATVDGVATRQYLTTQVLPRPRDLLFLVRAAIACAVNRRHAKVQSDDIEEALKQYSEFAFEVLRIEDASSERPIADNLIELVSGPTTWLQSELMSRIGLVGDGPRDSIHPVIARLASLGFLEIEVAPNEFRRAGDDDALRKLGAMARRVAQANGGEVRLRIHQAFRRYLELQTESHREGTEGRS